MIAKQLLTDEIMPLKTSDTGSEALGWMDDYRISHLPIVNNEEFLGLISDADIFLLNNFDEPLGNHDLSLSKSFVTEYQHIFEIIKLISEMKLSLVPVLDSKNRFLGSITQQRLIDAFAKMSAIDNPGGIIVLEMSNSDYSLSEISQIIESNNAKVLSLCVTSQIESTHLEVTIKVNTREIQSIIQTFVRYNYAIKASYSEFEDFDDLKDRYDSFMNYLNI